MNGSLVRELTGRALRAERERRGLTLTLVADKCYMSKSFLSEVERGEKEISSEYFMRVCSAMEQSPAEVMLHVARGLKIYEDTQRAQLAL